MEGEREKRVILDEIFNINRGKTGIATNLQRKEEGRGERTEIAKNKASFFSFFERKFAEEWK